MGNRPKNINNIKAISNNTIIDQFNYRTGKEIADMEISKGLLKNNNLGTKLNHRIDCLKKAQERMTRYNNVSRHEIEEGLVIIDQNFLNEFASRIKHAQKIYQDQDFMKECQNTLMKFVKRIDGWSKNNQKERNILLDTMLHARAFYIIEKINDYQNSLSGRSTAKIGRDNEIRFLKGMGYDPNNPEVTQELVTPLGFSKEEINGIKDPMLKEMFEYTGKRFRKTEDDEGSIRYLSKLFYLNSIPIDEYPPEWSDLNTKELLDIIDKQFQWDKAVIRYVSDTALYNSSLTGDLISWVEIPNVEQGQPPMRVCLITDLKTASGRLEGTVTVMSPGEGYIKRIADKMGRIKEYQEYIEQGTLAGMTKAECEVAFLENHSDVSKVYADCMIQAREAPLCNGDAVLDTVITHKNPISPLHTDWMNRQKEQMRNVGRGKEKINIIPEGFEDSTMFYGRFGILRKNNGSEEFTAQRHIIQAQQTMFEGGELRSDLNRKIQVKVTGPEKKTISVTDDFTCDYWEGESVHFVSALNSQGKIKESEVRTNNIETTIPEKVLILEGICRS